MGKPVKLQVGNKIVKSTDINYDDLVVLYKQFIDTYNQVPIYSLCDAKHNMPQGRIITKILKDNNILYGDFLLQFGKTKKVRTKSVDDYQLYKDRIIQIYNEHGNAPTINELTNYGLPSANWLIKNCPDNSVQTYTQFLHWCGLKDNLLKKDAEQVAAKLIQLEKDLGRPIKRSDITFEQIGFSPIVVNRIFGGLTNAKKQLGLMPTIYSPAKPFSFYKNHIDAVLEILSNKLERKYINWNDIESIEIDGYSCEHKTVKKAFDKEGLNFFAYLRQNGFMINTNNISFKYTFEDGENILSSLEYDVSSYLRELGFVYNSTYYRDVLYSSFCKEENLGRLNCDYKVIINDKILYIEVAGIIDYKKGYWKTYDFGNDWNNNYRDKMIYKENLLINNNINYLFIFPCNFYNKQINYKNIIKENIEEIQGNG